MTKLDRWINHATTCAYYHVKKAYLILLLVPTIIFSAFVPTQSQEEEKKEFIKWIDFNASSAIIARCNKSHKQLLEIAIDDIGTCELLAYLALKNGNSFNLKSDTVTLDKLIVELKNNNLEPIEKYRDNKYFKRYVDSYHAVLDGIIDRETGKIIGYHPIAKGFWHTGHDDFGVSRNYGFKRKHLGHDLYGSVGAPIIAMEGGTVSELGWNRYGGWRIGIRSHDNLRYYYYAHLRKDKPYPAHIEFGDTIKAGDVIGYLGNTGYSREENVNMSGGKPHLHFGIQVIFDESQEDGNGEIWVDAYNICKFLSNNKSRVEKNEETGDYQRSMIQ